MVSSLSKDHTTKNDDPFAVRIREFNGMISYMNNYFPHGSPLEAARNLGF
jgi:hypothetical protein